MNGRARTACWALVFSGLLSGCDGCEDSSDPGGGGAGGGPVGGNPPQGGEPNAGGGGAGGEGVGGEGGAPQPGTQVAITVIGDPDASPVEGVVVIASNPDASLAGEAVTDADGVATVVVPDGGSVSVLHKESGGFFEEGAFTALPLNMTRTFYLAPDATSLEVHVMLDEPAFPVVDPMNISFDVEQVPGATEYRLGLSCGYDEIVDAGPGSIAGFTGCGGQPFDALLVARDAEGVVVDYGFQTNVPYQPGADVALDLTFGQPLSPITLDATFAAGEQSQLITVGLRPSGNRSPIFFDRVEVDAPTSPLSLQVRQPSEFATRWCALGSISQSSGDLFVQVDCDDAPHASITLDENALGRLSATLEPTNVAFAIEANGPLGDGVQISAGGDSATDDDCGWLAYRVPNAGGNFTFPELPANQSAFAIVEIGLTEVQHIQFADDIGGDFIGHVASIAAQSVVTFGSGYTASALFLQP